MESNITELFRKVSQAQAFAELLGAIKRSMARQSHLVEGYRKSGFAKRGLHLAALSEGEKVDWYFPLFLAENQGFEVRKALRLLGKDFPAYLSQQGARDKFTKKLDRPFVRSGYWGWFGVRESEDHEDLIVGIAVLLYEDSAPYRPKVSKSSEDSQEKPTEEATEVAAQ